MGEGKKRKQGTVKFANSKKKKDEKPSTISAEERERKKQSLYRIPTSEELSELRENENLYKNNLFRMQIQYLLDEVCLKDKNEKKINQVLHSLNSFVREIPSQNTAAHIHEDLCLPDGVMLPLPSFITKDKVKGKFQFLPPSDVKIIGSFLLKTLLKSDSSIDVAVEIPKECLEQRDFLNFRYHFKRALYLSWVACAIRDWNHSESVTFIRGSDPYMPLIQIKLKGKVGKKYKIRVHAKLPDDFFKPSLFSPLKSNVRSSWFNCKDTDPSEDVECPTPHYNSSMLSDILHDSNMKAIFAAMNDCDGMKDAICLFKLWVHQRSFKGLPVLSGFIGSMVVVYLLNECQVSAQMSSYQIFRIMLHFLASTNLHENGISLCQDQKEEVMKFQSLFEVVFIDPSGQLNICANVDKVSYKWLQHQAKLSLDVLDDSSANGFSGLFISSSEFVQCVDQFFKLSKIDGFGKCHLEKDKLIDHGGNWTALVPSSVTPILERGLDNRIHRLVWKSAQISEWCITSTPPDLAKTVFWCGLESNTESCNNILIMGPPADQPEGKEFAAFWGEKSELRRFQDGSINEAVLWSCNTNEEKALISERIIKHLLQRHCNIPEAFVTYFGSEFNPLFDRFSIDNTEGVHLLKNFHELIKEVQNLNDIPLRIKSVDGIDPSFRLTDPHSTLQHITTIDSGKIVQLPKTGKKCPSLKSVHSAVIQFETCGKWPDDIDAIRNVKTAFHIKLAESIQKQLGLVSVPSPSFVDVIKNGYVFRLCVGHYREMVLHKEVDIPRSIQKDHALNAELLDIMIVKKPLHTSLIHSLNSHYHAFSATTKLCKRWVSAQMLSDFLCDEAIELIVASLFISPMVLSPPNSHNSGFFRFLHLIAKFDWNNDPLVVNFNDELKTADMNALREEFTTNRDKHPAMFLATPYSKTTSIWTLNNPSKQVLVRLSLLSDAALKMGTCNPDEFSEDLVQRIFRPSLKDFNVIINLNKIYVPLYYMSMDNSQPNKTSSLKENVSSKHLPVIDFNPPNMYLKELRDAFSDIAMFFYDKYGGTKIGVVWKPAALEAQNFKILNAEYKSLVEDKEKTGLSMVANLKAVISDFEVMGKGLVSSVVEQ